MPNFFTYFKIMFGNNYSDVLYTVLFVIISLVIYSFLKFTINKNKWSKEKKQKHISTIRNITIAFVLLTIVVIWSGHLKTLIFSAAAIFSAILLIFRELILSIIGTLISSKTYYIGDYIEFEGKRGLIMDKTLFTTKILLMMSITEETMTFPNLHYLSNKVINIPKFGKYIYNELTISIDTDKININKCLDTINKSMEITFNEYTKTTEKYIEEKIKQGRILTRPSITPELYYDLNDSKNTKIKIVFLAHPNDIKQLNTNLLDYYLRNIMV